MQENTDTNLCKRLLFISMIKRDFLLRLVYDHKIKCVKSHTIFGNFVFSKSYQAPFRCFFLKRLTNNFFEYFSIAIMRKGQKKKVCQFNNPSFIFTKVIVILFFQVKLMKQKQHLDNIISDPKTTSLDSSLVVASEEVTTSY